MATNSSNMHNNSIDNRDELYYEYHEIPLSHQNVLRKIKQKIGKKRNFPKLVLVVVGDSTAFVPKHWQTSVFKEGIAEIAKGARDCLILCEGTKKKVSTLVKEAVADLNKLQNKTKNEIDKCSVRIIGLVSDESSPDIISSSTQETTETLLLSQIAEEISQISTPLFLLNPDGSTENSLNMKVPVVTIVAEGDLKTIETIRHILQQDLPVLILKGSGKAADFIADVIEQGSKVTEESIKAKTTQFFGIIFHTKDYKQLKTNMKMIKKHKCLVTVLDINAEIQSSSFAQAVTNSVIVSWSEQAHKKINDDDQDIRKKSITLHAISKRLEPLQEEYFTLIKTPTLPLYYYTAYQYISEMETASARKKDMEILLREAIIADQIEYVSILLSEGVEFNINYFHQLYEETILPQLDDPTDFQHILKWGPKRPRKCLRYVNKYSTEQEDRNWLCVLSGRQICQSVLKYKKVNYDATVRRFGYENNIFSDLLIWAILANRPNLATLFWTKCCHQLLGALFISSLYKNMAYHVKMEEQHSDYNLWTIQAEKFAAIALNLQDKLYAEEPEMTMELLDKRETIWDIEASPLQCAHENLMYDVISHKSSQRQLNTVWYRDMGASSWGIWKAGFWLGCCCCCPPGIRCQCYFEEKSQFKLHCFFNTPFAKFLIHYLFYLTALFCFSAFMLVELDDFSGVASIEGYEWLVYIYVVTDMLEEYRTSVKSCREFLRRIWKQFSCTKSEEKVERIKHTFCLNLKKYFYDVWNCMDVISYCLIILAVIFRFTNSPKINTKVVRRTYSVALFAMYMRFLRVLLMSRKLGPKIIMIKEMFKDLFRFIGILFVFMMGVGVLYHANMYPKHVDMWSQKGWEYWRIWKIIGIPYWQIYGEPNLETFDDNSTTPCTTIKSQWESNPDIERCSQYDPILVIVAALYMLVSNLLLVNLVIALFSYSFEKVQQNSERLWRYMRFEIIDDFKTRIPAPLNLVWRPIVLMTILFNYLKKPNRVVPVSEAILQREEEQNKRMKIFKLQEMMSLKCVNGFDG